MEKIKCLTRYAGMLQFRNGTHLPAVSQSFLCLEYIAWEALASFMPQPDSVHSVLLPFPRLLFWHLKV